MGAVVDLRGSVFEAEALDGLPGEWVVRGGRDRFARVPEALRGVQQIGVIGWGSQGPAQACNLRDTLRGSPVRVAVGLRDGSGSVAAARAAGFDEAGGTLGEMFDVIRTSDLVVLLVSDAAQAELYPRIFEALKPGSTLGLSHGFLLGHLETISGELPEGVDVIGVCPKGMGPSVRRLYELGAHTEGAGINCSVAVERDVTGLARDRALGWAIALGAPWCFATTLSSEYRSDIFGERGVLLGALHGIAECLYRWHRARGDSARDAFEATAETLTGPVSRTISEQGLLGVWERLTPPDRDVFARAYAAAYAPSLEILTEIYDEVASGNEIRSVVLAGRRLSAFPMGEIEQGEMWEIGRIVRAERGQRPARIHPVVAGVYCATMIAQVDLLLERGHPRSEVVNESIVEAVDSLNPYMHARGVAYMIDNCSTTARLGARKWGPRFDAILSQQALPQIARESATDSEPIRRFLDHEIHESLASMSEYRPTVDLSL